MRRRRSPEVIGGQVQADGTILAGDGFTVAKTGTGIYVLSFPAGFRVVSCVANSLATAEAVKTTYGSGQVTAIPLTTAAAAVDSAFSFVAVGVQT